jgi:hypothetical protein
MPSRLNAAEIESLETMSGCAPLYDGVALQMSIPLITARHSLAVVDSEYMY